MATGVKPRDEESQLTKNDLEVLEDAMKNKKFRDLLADYCEEIRAPENQATYQKEMTQLEKERGYDITFINPKGGYVIKTSVAGDRKAFINICSNDNVGKPSFKVMEVDGQRGMNWQIPYSLIPPREDYDNKRERCVVYDVVYHPDTLRMAEVNKRFRELVNKTAFDALNDAYSINLDSNNFRFPKSFYKGMSTPAVIRKEDPDYKPPTDEETADISPEVMDKLFPQRSYSESTQASLEKEPPKNANKNEFPTEKYVSDNRYTKPKYIIKHQKNVDLQDYTFDKNNKQYSAIPSQIVIEINLPLLSSTKDCNLDVQEKSLSLLSEKPAKYKLNINLPYSVNEQCGHAKFDKTKRLLIVTLPVIRKTFDSDFKNSKVDSGVESEELSGSQSDEDVGDKLITELVSSSVLTTLDDTSTKEKTESMKDHNLEPFLNPSVGYILPAYTHNVLDNMVAFTFHVKNTEPDSVHVLSNENVLNIKFTSVGAGFTPVHYSALIIFEDGVEFHNVSGEAWDNNVILQAEITGKIPREYQIGLHEDSMICEHFNTRITTQTVDDKPMINPKELEDTKSPVVEVTNLSTETNIVVTSKISNEMDEIETAISPKEREILWTDTNESNAKGILRKPMRIARSLSESSVDIASSMDYVSSDCIPEESSLKKTVRFSDVIARQFYRYNSSIEGQKKKNQRKKSKKRNQERRKSESEADDDSVFGPDLIIVQTAPQKPLHIPNFVKVKTDFIIMASKTTMKSAVKERRDSGLADTSDAETEFKSSLDSTPSPTYELHPDGSGIFGLPQNETPQASIVDILDRKQEAFEEPLIWQSDGATKSHGLNIPECSRNGSGATKKKSKAKFTCEDIEHNTDLYNPDNLNKGHYLEVKFKNDLIFHLDM